MPMPGSTITGTAPILNRAKVMAKNSVLRRHHQNRAHALGNPGRDQGMGRAIAQPIELSRRQASVAAALVGHRDGQRVGLLRGHYWQPRGDVAGRVAGRAHGVGCSARNVVISGMISSPASSSM